MKIIVIHEFKIRITKKILYLSMLFNQKKFEI